MTASVSADPATVAVRSIHAMADGTRAEFEPLYHPQAVDRENRIQPPPSRVPGPEGFSRRRCGYGQASPICTTTSTTPSRAAISSRSTRP